MREVGLELRGTETGEAGFADLAEELGRSTSACYNKWMRIQTPKKMRESSGEEGETGRRRSRVYVRGDVAASTERELQALRVEVAALKAENRTLRAFAGMGGKRRKRARSRERGRDRDRDRDRDRRHRRCRRRSHSRSRSRHHSPIGSSSSSISDWMSS